MGRTTWALLHGDGLADFHAAIVLQAGAALGQRDRRFEVVGVDEHVTRQDVATAPGAAERRDPAHPVPEVGDPAADLLEPLAPGSFLVGAGRLVAPAAE